MARVFGCFAADYGDLLRPSCCVCYVFSVVSWLAVYHLPHARLSFVSFSDLSNNQITSIAGDAFHGLKSLTSL